MKIVVDDKVPFIEGAFPALVEVVAMPGGRIAREDVADADALIVRTRTRCDRSLLEGSKVRHISTATIGFDHIDMEYCRQAGISVATSAGCNAQGVLQYVIAALLYLEGLLGEDIRSRRLGIVGVGNVGSSVEVVASALGFEVVCCDPFVDRVGFVSLEQLVESVDIITIHTPLTRLGSYPTYEMFNKAIFDRVRDGAILINSSRGEVIDERAFIEALSCGKISHAVVDVWQGEPDINPQLLEMATIATAHIAGYSMQGKAMGSAMALRAVASALSIDGYESWYPKEVKPTVGGGLPSWSHLSREMLDYYDIAKDCCRLKSAPHLFEQLRGDYCYREEFFSK